MTSKTKIINMLGKCLKLEEYIIPIYSKHISNTLFLSGFEKKEQLRIKKILDKLRTDSEKHRIIFESLIKKIKESNKDVY